MYTYILYVCTCIGCRQRVVSVSAYTCAQRPFHAHVSAVPRYDMHAGMYVTTTRKEKEKLLLYVAGLQGPLPYTLRTHTHLWHTYAIHTHTHSACTCSTHTHLRHTYMQYTHTPSAHIHAIHIHTFGMHTQYTHKHSATGPEAIHATDAHEDKHTHNV
jgi:hypothetical protein